MRAAVLDYRIFLFVCMIAVGFLRMASAAEPLLIVGQAETKATLLSVSSEGKLQFEIQGKAIDVSLQELVRWSTQKKNSARSELLLTDGGCIVLADAWTDQPSWQLDDDTISLTTQLFGKVELPRNQVRALLLHAPKGLKQRSRFLDRLLESEKKSDTIFLINGDQWQGRVESLAESATSGRLIHLLQETAITSLPIPEKQIAAILFAHQEVLPEQEKNLVLGLRNGSLLMAKSLAADAEQARVLLAGGMELTGFDRPDVVCLRSLTTSCLYLSDLTAVEYQPTPFFRHPEQLSPRPQCSRWPIDCRRSQLCQGARSVYRVAIDLLARRDQTLPPVRRHRGDRRRSSRSRQCHFSCIAPNRRRLARSFC